MTAVKAAHWDGKNEFGEDETVSISIISLLETLQLPAR